MSPEITKKRRANPMHSLFFKCTAIVAMCVLVVIAAIEIVNHNQVMQKAMQDLQNRAQEVTSLLAMQLGGSIKFGNADALDQIVGGVMKEAGRDAVGAMVVDRQGTPMFTTQGTNFDQLAAQKLVNTALETQQNAHNAAGTAVAIPVNFGGENAVVGAVVTSWTDEFSAAEMAQDLLVTLLIGVGVLLAALGAAGYFLFSHMSRPLTQLENAMKDVAEGNYDVTVPHTARQDEIGKMAGRLENFRKSLEAAKDTSRENAFKSAAFIGSSAQLMMVDEGFKVIFANPACERLMAVLMPDLNNNWPGVDPSKLVGADLTMMTALQDAIVSLRAYNGTGQSQQENTSVVIRLGHRVVQVKMNTAIDPMGNLIGCVIEWNDRTDAQRNAALIDALNANQISIEFDEHGKVCDANTNFLTLIDGKKEDTAVCTLAKMFAGNLENDPKGHVFHEEVLAQNIKQGRFSAYSSYADKSFVLEGSFAVLTGAEGRVERMIFLATDVTAQDQSVRQAEAERAQVAQEQGNVVDLLGVALNNLADGDLQANIAEDVPPAYEKLRSDFNATVEALRDAISAVIHNADSIRNETTEITSAADDLSRRTEKQAATLEETAAALDELTVSVKSAAQGADDASKMSENAQKNAEQGGIVARQAVEAMDGIKTSSQEISKITSVIDDIAFQTNLLALNAGVEAARAGEAGRGFAVVATEVRALAQRSSDAAREINALISSSGDQVRQGVDLVDKTGAALASIVTSVSEISNRVANIATSAREQSSGLAEINSAVTELDHVTQQNAAMFEETTAASHALTAEADALANAVSRFRLNKADAHGGSEVSEFRPAPPQSAVSVVPRHQGNLAYDLSQEPESDGWEEF
ncbi:MAG: methyl-accepting chemotaxis protein [Sulfitobacter sp.]